MEAARIFIAFLIGLLVPVEMADRSPPADLGVRAWEWAEDYCRDYGGLADFRVVELREAQAVCAQGEEQAVRTLRRGTYE